MMGTDSLALSSLSLARLRNHLHGMVALFMTWEQLQNGKGPWYWTRIGSGWSGGDMDGQVEGSGLPCLLGRQEK